MPGWQEAVWGRETPGEACACGAVGRSLAEEGERPASEGRQSGWREPAPLQWEAAACQVAWSQILALLAVDRGRLRGCSGFFFAGLWQRLWEDALAPGRGSLLGWLFPQSEEQELRGSESPGTLSCDPVFMDGLESSWVLSEQWCIPHLWFLPP